MKFTNRKSLLSIIIFSIIAVLFVGILLFVQERTYLKKVVISHYQASADQLAQNLSIHLKINDIASMSRVINNSYLALNTSVTMLTDNNNQLIFKIPRNANTQCLNDTGHSKINYNNRMIGTLSYCYIINNKIQSKISKMLISFLFVFLFIIIGTIYYIININTYQLRTFVSHIDNINPNTAYFPQPQSRTNSEMQRVYDKMDHLFNKLNKAANIKKNAEKIKATAQISSQVAHDIRSPLAALDMVVKDMHDIPEEKRIMIRGSVSRIHDIANDLLVKNKSKNLEIKTNKLSNIMLSDLLSSLLSEKRLQLRDKVNINIESNIDSRAYGIFTKINVKEFSRVISNLINNSAEAFINETGTITLDLFTNPQNSNQLQININDNGKGIPKDMISKLGVKGNTFGKVEGSGLGLFHAKTTIESWNGNFIIESTQGKGTTIKIVLPKAELPKTFISDITLTSNESVVILDDDQSIHQIWKGRFESSTKDIDSLKLIHFSDPYKFKDWFKSNSDTISYYLVDYEFLGHKTNGIQVIKDLNIEEKAILVTSRYCENNVRDLCETNKIKLLPKGLAVYVPIIIKKSLTDSDQHYTSEDKKICNIFLDDDLFIRMGWKSIAKKKEIPLDLYETGEELLDVIDQYDKASTFYIDSTLGNNIKGEDIAKILFDKGFTNLYLATGYDKDHFENIEHIKDVIGKDCPF